MVKFNLQVKATVENVSQFKPEDEQSFGWNIKFKCSNCGEEMDKYARLEQIEKKSMPGSRGEANLVIKCKLCSRVNSADLIPNSTAAYRQEDSDKYKTIVQLECRGIEPTDCFMGQGFIVTSEAGTTFADVNLEEGEWVDYDERSNSSVGVYGLQHQFVKV